MADTKLSAAALLRVLEGAAVATKAPQPYIQPLTDWWQKHDSSRRSDSPLGTSTDNDKEARSSSLAFEQWRDVIEGIPQLNDAGVKQLWQIVLGVALLRERSRSDAEIDSHTLDIIWTLIFQAIVDAQNTELRFAVSRSAQGFLAVPLCSLLKNGKIEELWRFHTWIPDGQRGIDPKVSIHAHQPFGQSWTLLGCGTDLTFHVDSPEDPSLTTHAAYECCYASADGKQTGASYQTHQMSSTIRSSGRLLRVKDGKILRHVRDSVYSVPGGAYHRSVIPGARLHATLFVFDAHRGYDDDAAVLGPKEGGEYVQLRDPAGNTPVALVQMAAAARKWEQTHNVASYAEEEHPTVIAYYRFFRGLGLLNAGQQADAMLLLNPNEGLAPLHAFAKEPLPTHREYIKQLVNLGVDTNRPDDEGRTALDYAKQHGDHEIIGLLISH